MPDSRGVLYRVVRDLLSPDFGNLTASQLRSWVNEAIRDVRLNELDQIAPSVADDYREDIPFDTLESRCRQVFMGDELSNVLGALAQLQEATNGS